MNGKLILTTDVHGVKLYKRGKVRDVYDLDDYYLIVCSDRISCFDVVLPTGIPGKGTVLTSISRFWFDHTKNSIPNHLVSSDMADFPAELQPFREVLEGRSMLVQKAELIPFEFIVRGYLLGSAWKEYKATGTVCGIKLPEGMREAEQLPEPIFTPSTKADEGHDMNITVETLREKLDDSLVDTIMQTSIELYRKANEYANTKGIIIADTKFEFGNVGGQLTLIDEALTPDSSRFWDLNEYRAGSNPPSLDKQFVRDYLESLGWDKTPPGPELPEEVVQETAKRYRSIAQRITGAGM